MPKNNDDRNFFDLLGTEPAMRRAYRLWVQAALKLQDGAKIDFFTRNLTDNALNNYWHNESLIAILNSPYCAAFLNANLSLLKANDWRLLFKIIQVMRTAAKESTIYLGQRIYIPSGAGWSAIITILNRVKKDISAKYFNPIQDTLFDWSWVVLTSQHLPQSTADAGQLAFYLLQTKYPQKEPTRKNPQLEQLIVSIYRFTGGILPEVKELIAASKIDSIAPDIASAKDTDWLRFGYGVGNLHNVQNGLSATELAKYLPDIVIDVLKFLWYDNSYDDQGMAINEMPNDIPNDIQDELKDFLPFGLKMSSKEHKEIASAYRTPVYWLLIYHPDIALPFVVAMVNRCTTIYLANLKKQKDLATISLRIPNGKIIDQVGDPTLWMLFRGYPGNSSVVLGSVLMALEKYLLDLGAQGSTRQELFRQHLQALYENSISVAITAVIASVVQAYPLMAGDLLLPLLSNKDIYQWEILRYKKDMWPENHYLLDSTMSDEQHQSYMLPHRREFAGGLRSFLLHYTIQIGTLNDEIFTILDQLRATADPFDATWIKELDQMDSRNLVNPKENSIVDRETQKLFDKDIFEHLMTKKAFSEVFESETQDLLKNAFIDEDIFKWDLDHWLDLYEKYSKCSDFSNTNIHFSLIARTGIGKFQQHLTANQLEWCIETIININEEFLYGTILIFPFRTRTIDHINQIAALDYLPSLLLIPLVIQNTAKREQIEDLIFRVLLIGPRSRARVHTRFRESIEPILWHKFPQMALLYWEGLVAYSTYTVYHVVRPVRNPSKSIKKRYQQDVNRFISLFTKGKIKAHTDAVTFHNVDYFRLHNAVHFSIPPANCILLKVDALSIFAEVSSYEAVIGEGFY